MNIINEYSNVFYHSSEVLNSEGQLGLMKEIYYSESIQQKAVSSAGWADEEGIFFCIFSEKRNSRTEI